jgi:hypothetical protein
VEDEPTTAQEVEHREPAGSAKVERSIPAAGAEVKRGRTSLTAVAQRTSSPVWRMSPRWRARAEPAASVPERKDGRTQKSKHGWRVGK